MAKSKIDHNKRAILKDGKLMMANSHKARTFKNINTAHQFIFNLIGVSNKLSMDNFRLIRCNG